MRNKKEVKRYWIEKKAEYQKLANFADYIKEDIAPIIAKRVPPPVRILKIRKKAVEFFKNKSFVTACKKCKGKCCGLTGPHMDYLELIYLYIVNTDFSLPKPDWRLLESQATILNKKVFWSPCIFLGPSGCLLKNNRPVICLSHICGEFYQVIEKEKLDCEFLYSLRKSLNNWRKKIKLKKSPWPPLINTRVFHLLDNPIETLKETLKKQLLI